MTGQPALRRHPLYHPWGVTPSTLSRSKIAAPSGLISRPASWLRPFKHLSCWRYSSEKQPASIYTESSPVSFNSRLSDQILAVGAYILLAPGRWTQLAVCVQGDRLSDSWFRKRGAGAKQVRWRSEAYLSPTPTNTQVHPSVPAVQDSPWTIAEAQLLDSFDDSLVVLHPLQNVFTEPLHDLTIRSFGSTSFSFINGR